MGWWVMLIHGIPLLVLPALQLANWLSLAVVSVILASFTRTWRLQVRRQHPEAISSLVWSEDRRCLLRRCSGRQEETYLWTQAFIHPQLVIMHFGNGPLRRRYLVLLPDMLDHESFRKLRVRLTLEINTPDE